jgi:hypothetical protein
MEATAARGSAATTDVHGLHNYNRPGNHHAEVMYPSGLTRTPVHTLNAMKLGGISWEIKGGGDPGRVFQFKYMVGRNANLRMGLFLFRLDYWGYHLTPPRFDLHYHVKWGPVNKNHVSIF